MTSILVLAGCGGAANEHGAHNASTSGLASFGGISSGGLPPLCPTNLSGLSYSGGGLEIEFFTSNKASFRNSGDDIKYLVDYAARTDGFVTLTDQTAPGLKTGRVFLMACDSSEMSDWNDRSIVLKLQKSGQPH